MKRKAITSTFQGMERRLTRLQAKATASSSTKEQLLLGTSMRLRACSLSSMMHKPGYYVWRLAQMDSLSSKSPSQIANLVPNQCVSLPSSKGFKETENANIPELEKSGNESIPTLKGRSCLQESDQNSSSSTSAGLRLQLVLSPAQVDSPTAPSGYVQSHAIVGDKTKEYNNIRIAETSIENNSASEGTFNTENFNSKLVGQNQGREESDRDALALVTAKNISGVTVETITSNTTSGRQVAPEEARVISNVVLEIAKEVNSCKTTDEHLRPTYSIGLSEMANMFAADDSNQDEVQSFLFDPALISVQGYRVKEASATILRNVMKKHGDIARNCFVETVESRSFFLEKVCEIIQTLQTTKFVNITQTEVEKMLALVGDLGRVNLGVGWLQKRLEEILEVIKLIKQSSQLKESRGRNAQIIQESKRALKSYEARILVHEAEIEALKEKASLEKEKMNAAQVEDRIITQRVSNLKPKVKLFIKESFVHDLQ
ncbi:uncharacterized protein LOC111293278 [Durio zibethinus]|uniref:Uncharacterized protein LOC111293278 n=1 Tax=Durio zibethinus TaxID=66656 RepID=A0A6P5YNV6_DURZI|nr:uncharacterized protein LOC111293278 [Durio zibethinus]